MSSTPQSTTKNYLLASLTDWEYERFQEHFEPCSLEHGKILYEIDEPIKYCYFPYEAVVSLVTEMADGKVVEVALVGNEGLTGLQFMLGQKKSLVKSTTKTQRTWRTHREIQIGY